VSDPLQIAAKKGFSVVYNGKALLSLIDPLRQAEKLIAALLPAKERTLYLCPSPLFGYGLDHFAENLPDNSALLCIEADKALYEWTLERCQSPFELYYTNEPLELCRFVREKWGLRAFRRIELVKLTGGYNLFPGLYENCAETLRREIEIEWGNAMTLTRLGRLYSRNLIRNLPRLAGGTVAGLHFGDTPVLVAGAGPSLDAFLDFLRGREKTFVLIAVDTAAASLLQRGLAPDLVVALEAQHWNLKDFIGCGGAKIPIAMDLSALPATAECLGGRPLFFFTPWTDLRLFSRLKSANLLPPRLPPLGSVGLSAVSLAGKLSSGPCVCAGLDFSFTPDKYHCRGSPTHRAFLRNCTRLTSPYPAAAAFRGGTARAASKSGTMVRTDAPLQNYRGLFENEFGKNNRIFDIEGSGLPLGVQTLTFEEAAEKLNRIKEPGELLYEKETPGHIISEKTTDEAGGNGDKPLADNGDNHLDTLSPESLEKSSPQNEDRLPSFIKNEIATLTEILDILTGKHPDEGARLESLLDEADYLWAHFPDCAGAGGRRPPASDTGFLKRVRAEIEPFLRLWEGA
jgi:hypothetical protein